MASSAAGDTDRRSVGTDRELSTEGGGPPAVGLPANHVPAHRPLQPPPNREPLARPAGLSPGAANRYAVGAEGTYQEREWRSLRYFNFYRVILAGLLVALALAGIVPRPEAAGASPTIFLSTSIVYAVLGIVFSFAMRHRTEHLDIHVIAHVFVDIIVITALMHVSGGVTSGLGLLLVVAVAGGSILARGHIANLLPAMASVAVLTEQLVAWQTGNLQVVNYTYAGILGAIFFATSWLARVSSTRLRASEALVAERDLDLRNLAELNETIIARMQSGILVADANEQVVLCNESARTLLGIEPNRWQGPLGGIDAALHRRYERWCKDTRRSSYGFQCGASQLDLTASFAALGAQGQAGVLVFLEDASPMTQRAQQLKLASLGRLTASIAHEIRNPLGAISHAGQLLGESEVLNAADRRLSQIIQDNCRRVNVIIEDVLQLSRRRPAVREDLDLRVWLESFVNEQRAAASSTQGTLVFSFQSNTSITVPFDPDQLRQVVANLVENGLRHSPSSGVVELQAGITPESDRPYLDAIDEGDGIAPDDRNQVFEPFFTTRAEGTGLGLYIARELCEINQASLRLLPSERGCRFRITFADPRRRGSSEPIGR